MILITLVFSIGCKGGCGKGSDSGKSMDETSIDESSITEENADEMADKISSELDKY